MLAMIRLFKLLHTFLYLLFAAFFVVECLECQVGNETYLVAVHGEPHEIDQESSPFQVQQCQDPSADRCLLVNVSYVLGFDPPHPNFELDNLFVLGGCTTEEGCLSACTKQEARLNENLTVTISPILRTFKSCHFSCTCEGSPCPNGAMPLGGAIFDLITVVLFFLTSLFVQII